MLSALKKNIILVFTVNITSEFSMYLLQLLIKYCNKHRTEEILVPCDKRRKNQTVITDFCWR